MNLEGEFWEFNTEDSGKTQVALVLSKDLKAEDLKFWRDRIVDYLDHLIRINESQKKETL